MRLETKAARASPANTRHLTHVVSSNTTQPAFSCSTKHEQQHTPVVFALQATGVSFGLMVCCWWNRTKQSLLKERDGVQRADEVREHPKQLVLRDTVHLRINHAE